MMARVGKNISFAGSTYKLNDRYDVPRITDLQTLRKQIRRVIGDRKICGTVMTFGSCFAVNVGTAINASGGRAYTLQISEEVNCPFNNVLLLKRVFVGERAPLTDELEEKDQIDWDVVKTRFQWAESIIFTLGNIFHLESNGESNLESEGADLIGETFDETVAHMREIFALLKEHTKGEIYVTVSPIPIAGYRGDEFASAIEADCASKSQLRAAIRKCEGINYIPVFEVFKWLPPHQDFATFGIDDGKSRHLGRDHVALVMEALA